MVKTSPSNVGSVGSIPGWGAKIPHASWPKNTKNIKQTQYCNKFNKDLKDGLHQKKIFKKINKRKCPGANRTVSKELNFMVGSRVLVRLFLCVGDMVYSKV